MVASSRDPAPTSVASDDGPFGAGPYPWLVKSPPFRFVGRSTWRCVLATAAITWLPLALLAAVEGHALAATPHQSLLLDLEAYVRYLVAAPLFVGAASVYLPQLASAVHAFVDAEIIARHDLDRYQALVGSTRRLMASRVTDVGLLAVAYIVTFAAPAVQADGATWARPAAESLSYAGWWRLLVSHPLFIALWAAWVWRLLLWVRFLWVVARMDLRLVATHPDRLGGMRFILTPLRGFTVLAFAVGTIAAGTIAEAIIVDARLPIEFRYFIGAQVVTVLVAFAGPLLLLSLPLVRLQERGTVEWGQAASRLGREFQKRWTEPGHREMNADALGVPDFSATVDLFGIVAGVQNINPLVLDVRPVLLLVLATLLPYVPVVFAVMPFDQVMQLALKALS